MPKWRGAAPRLAVRKPSPHRDTLLRLRANKFRLGTVAIFYGRERQSNRVFNDERILAFIPLSFAQNSFDSSDDSESLTRTCGLHIGWAKGKFSGRSQICTKSRSGE